MIVLSIEEFAARRRTAQTRIEDALRPIVAEAADTTIDTDGWTPLLDAVHEQYMVAYAAEAGEDEFREPEGGWRENLLETLRKTTPPRDEATTERITVWLATWILSQATIEAAVVDPEELFLEWVDMKDADVRPAHKATSGQVRPTGVPFDVDGVEMPYPGWSGAPIELWINCRCTLRPLLASEFAGLTLAALREVSPAERKRDAGAGRAMPDGSFPIDNCQDLKNAIQAIGRAKNPGAVKSHIRRRKSSLGCPEVSIPESWAITEETQMSETFTITDTEPPENSVCAHPECRELPTKSVTSNAQGWSALYCEAHAAEHEDGDLPVDAPFALDDEEDLPPEPGPIPWHGVLVVEGKKSGDNRGFRSQALRSRPLPLPLSWQKVSTPGHDNAVVAARIDHEMRVPAGEGVYEVRAHGIVRNTPEADEMVGLLADFGRFGVSIDADEAVMEFDEDAEDEVVWFADAQVAGACVVGIPAFYGAWVSLGDPPDDFYEGGTELTYAGDEVAEHETLVAAAFVDVAPGRTEDGPGWLTHPVDTDRLRDYWVRGPGAAKIGWGSPGDFDRCRLHLAEYVKPQHLNGYCANRHYDALGFWPGRNAHAVEPLEFTEAGEMVTLVAGGSYEFQAKFFTDPMFGETSFEDKRLVRQSGDNAGKYGCPLTITDDGQVYGHVALWDTCHTAFPGTCTVAPHSESGYAHFLLGEVITTDGPLPVGTLSIGGGHAPHRMGGRAAMEHYDRTSTAFAYVNCGEDEHGIWIAGALVPGTPEDVVIAARAAKLSGDWRGPAGREEMIAALAVNVPGFPVQRVAAGIVAGRQVSLVAAGMVEGAPEPEPFEVEGFIQAIAAAVEERMRNRVEMKRIAARINPNREAMEMIAARVNGVE